MIDRFFDRAINCSNLGNRYIWRFFASNTISILIFHSFQLPFIAFILPLRQAISISKLQAVYKRCLPTTYSLSHGSGESCVIGNIYLCHCRYWFTVMLGFQFMLSDTLLVHSLRHCEEISCWLWKSLLMHQLHPPEPAITFLTQVELHWLALKMI